MCFPRTRKYCRKTTLLIVAILSIAVFNIVNLFLHGLPEGTSNRLSPTYKKVKSIIPRKVTLSIPIKTLSNTSTIQTLTTTTTKKIPITNKDRTIPTDPTMKTSSTYYNLGNDKRYQYEFRFEYNITTSNMTSANETQRLMILLNGSGRTCTDYWEFPVGRRMLAAFRAHLFLILAICSKRKKFDPYGPAYNNLDAKWIYFSLQKWIHEVYYKQYQHYPLLYFHGISRGSKLASILSRYLPIQAQIFTIYPADTEAMLIQSEHHIDLQTRLQLDPVFANWFYFDFCYQKTETTTISPLCPYQRHTNYFQPVVPTYFFHVKDDPIFKEKDYTSLLKNIHSIAFKIGGILLNQTQSLKIQVIPPLPPTPSYLQETYDIWFYKPYASEIFFQHLIAPKQHLPSNATRKTCLCLHIDFRYYELHPEITKTWTKEKQEQYIDYAKDVKKFEKYFCEDICGDLLAHHAMISRGLDKALNWTSEIDSLRRLFYINDYLVRPLRIWMYDKDSINKNIPYLSLQLNNISKSNQMYSPEYQLQDYFQRLKTSNNHSHNFKWIDNPLLADYFIIPHDLMSYYFNSEPANITGLQFQNLRKNLNNAYFEPLIRNVRTMFPYWTMVKQGQMGSNHIIAMLDGRNMGFLHNRMQNELKNVIQLSFTGIREDLLPPNTPPSYTYRNTTVVYRHGYDVIIPQFTRLNLNESTHRNLNLVLKNKKRLFFFAGDLAQAMTSKSARPLLSHTWKDLKEKQPSKVTTEIQGKQFDTITIIDGQIKPDEYIESIKSSVFALCPEGFLPWSPQLYQAIQLRAIPFILADNIVLPFERFIDWRSFSAKINISNIQDMMNYVQQINNFEQYIKQKLQNARPYLDAFQWPYTVVNENGQNKYVFLQNEDKNGAVKNIFHYLSLELRCRRLEQLYGLTSDSFSEKSIEAQRQVCTNYSTICPCYSAQRSVAFQEYI
jgi:hypothetical protein